MQRRVWSIFLTFVCVTTLHSSRKLPSCSAWAWMTYLTALTHNTHQENADQVMSLTQEKTCRRYYHFWMEKKYEFIHEKKKTIIAMNVLKNSIFGDIKSMTSSSPRYWISDSDYNTALIFDLRQTFHYTFLTFQTRMSDIFQWRTKYMTRLYHTQENGYVSTTTLSISID